PGLRSGGRRGDVPGRTRPEHADLARLAARLAPEARPLALRTVSAIPLSRCDRAADTRANLRAGYRDLADMHRCARRVSDRVDRRRPRLSVRRGAIGVRASFPLLEPGRGPVYP